MSEKIAIIGGGIAGLTAAFFLKEKGHEVTVFEKESQPGGNMKSQAVEGFTCESGPNTVLINNEGIARLLQRCGLLGEIVSPDEKAHKNRFILKGGRMVAVPTGPPGFINTPLLGMGQKLRLMREPFIKAHSPQSEPSLEDFAVHRFGRQFYAHFIVPFVTGIYAGDPSRMSARYAMKILWEAEQEGGSVFRGFMKRAKRAKALAEELDLPKQKMFTLRNGLQALPLKLSKQLGDAVKLGTELTEIGFGEKGISLSLKSASGAEQLSFDRVIATQPAYHLGSLLVQEDAELGARLQSVEYVPAVVMHVAFPKQAIQDQTPGFGVLSLPSEKVSYLGILFNSRTFPHTAPPDQDLFTVIIGGARSPELTHLSEAELQEDILKEMRELLGIEGEPSMVNFVHWKRGIPQYDLDHGKLLACVEKFEAAHPGFHILGNYVRGISVSDCIDKSYQLANSLP